MKTYLITGFFWLIATTLSACPLCDKRQPKGFAGITHGTGPEGAFDYWMLYGSIAVVVLTLLLFIRFMIRPDTIAMNHLKRHSFPDWQHE
ncbi:MAG: hypothetical protein LH609_03020 [Rudanella sp.]|nr:hypothetical protein [Rudanella sp.]